MLWFILSLSTAFLMATNGAYMKRFYSDVNPWEMSIIPFFYATPLCAITMLFVEIPPLGPDFFFTLGWMLPLTMGSIILHFRAIHMSPLSLTLPFLSFTPVFVFITGDLLLGETLNTMGTIGILLVVAGGYVLNLDAARHGFLGPIKAIFKEPGSAIMLLVAALYGLASVGGKVLILNSSPMFAAMILFVLYGPLLTLLLVATGKASFRTIVKKPLLGAGVGIII
ncbi:DMT family transporter, partial [Pseudodesulfovibrio sp.]|nr:DMT family transporter [Pseudodesulfovibrio sp.]